MIAIDSDEFWESSERISFANNQLTEPDNLTELPVGAVLFASSGSSGVAKWIVHTRSTLRASACAVNEYFGIDSNDVLGVCLPEYHVGGFGMSARAYWAGANCVKWNEKWSPVDVRTWFEDHSVTVTSMVPTQIHDLVGLAIKAPDALRVVVVGGGTLSQELGQRARALGWPVLQSYGMTEAGSQIATQPLSALDAEYTPNKIALLPIWDVEIDRDEALKISGNALAWGQMTRLENGEWNLTQYDQWFTTQDRVVLNDGRLSFLGRHDRVIKVRGELVDLDCLENRLKEYFSTQIVLIAQPSSREGYEISAIATSMELTCDQVNSQMPRYAMVKELVNYPSIPTTPLGKIDRRTILNQHSSKS